MTIPVRPDSPVERAAFAHVPDLAARLAAGDLPDGPGHWAEVEPRCTVAGLPAGDVVLAHVTNAVVWPRRGLVMTTDGMVVHATEQGARMTKAQMARLPGMKVQGGALQFVPPSGMGRMARGMVWMNFGAQGNYGHFLFDALTGLCWADRAGLTRGFPPIAPPLTRWQRDLVGHAGVSASMAETRQRVVTVDHLILTTAQNHYLHRNAGLLQALSGAMEPHRRVHVAAGPPVYFSRRGLTGRIMLNEAELERALSAQGVAILRPARMTVAAQIAAVQGARALIGPSGAALANLVFAAPGTRLVEIRPGPVQEPWLDLACANLGLNDVVVPALGPVSPAQVPLWARALQLPRSMTGRYHYAYRADISATLAALG